MIIRDKLESLIPKMRKEAKDILTKYGSKAVGEVSIEQIFSGMRGIKGLICDTSEVNLDSGLLIRGIPILDLVDRFPEEIFYLMLTGELPDAEALDDLQWELKRRNDVPFYVWVVLSALPYETHPMVMLNTAILLMENESFFKKRYEEGMDKSRLWEPMLYDCLNIIARVPVIAAFIYRRKFNKGPKIEANPDLDWAANYAHMLGVEKNANCFYNLMRLYLTLHADHEGGNVSTFTSLTISSALSDPYYAVSGGLNGLAGPLHGLANQECLRFIMKLRDDIGHSPTDEEVKNYCQNTLAQKKVIPGYGHAVLRVTDPRFTALIDFACGEMPDDALVHIVNQLYKVVPNLLIEQGKAKDPWPNVDAASGSLLHRFGLTEYEYYTVVFSVSRILGLCAQLILARALNLPIIRPKSVTMKWIKDTMKKTEKESVKKEPEAELKK
jgi:citrate synthase